MKTTHPQRQKRALHRSGFTLIELLIVIAIIAALALISFPAASLVMNQARKTQASSQVENLVNAVKLFETNYLKLPVPDGAGGDEEIATDSDFIDILTGADRDGNPKGTSFLEGKEAKKASGNKPARSGFVSEGNGSQSLVDPWGNFYQIIMDADGDNEIDAPGTTNPLRTSVIGWSYGKPESKDDEKSAKDKDPSEWIKSW